MKRDYIKPPLGLMPKKHWIDRRISDINSAINRYMECGKEVPIEWIEEYNELIEMECD
jgi:hypothetical protein